MEAINIISPQRLAQSIVILMEEHLGDELYENQTSHGSELMCYEEFEAACENIRAFLEEEVLDAIKGFVVPIIESSAVAGLAEGYRECAKTLMAHENDTNFKVSNRQLAAFFGHMSEKAINSIDWKANETAFDAWADLLWQRKPLIS